tara:strand:- start:92 stop:214 length:123 start_codon:yes stop_codon:yes gene_type:complete
MGKKIKGLRAVAKMQQFVYIAPTPKFIFILYILVEKYFFY